VRAINDITDPRLVKALAHPLRVSILSALAHRVASPSQLAEELDVPLPNLSYHIRMLVQLDLLKLVKTRPRRGAIEHYYQAKGPVTVSDKAWGEVPNLVKEAMVSAHLRQTGEMVDAAAATGGFDDDKAVLTRLSLKLDQQAWAELSAKVQDLYGYAETLLAESETRRKEGDHEDEIDAGLVLMLFNAVPASVQPAAAASVSSDGAHKRAGAGATKRTRARGRATSSS
jgi:DNA-binding transcriptional ArsR family regulator